MMGAFLTEEYAIVTNQQSGVSQSKIFHTDISQQTVDISNILIKHFLTLSHKEQGPWGLNPMGEGQQPNFN